MRPKLSLMTVGSALGMAVLAPRIGGEVRATDWPRFRGAELCAVSPDPSLDRWPTNGLGAVWRVPSATSLGGYGSFAVSGGKVFTLRNLLTNGQPKEFCVALDATSGTQVWARVLGREMAYSTPTVEAGRVYVYGGELKLFCLEADTGAILWQRDMCAEFGSMTAQNSQSPCVEGERVFVSILAPTNCLLAFNVTNGALLWRGHTNALTYGSPIGATVHGVRQIVFSDRFGLVSVAPDSGQMLWRHKSGNSYEQGPSPLLHEDLGVWVPTDSVGGEAFRILDNDGVFSTERLWTNATLSGTFVTLVIHDGYLYGIFGSSLQCVDLVTGQLQWRTNTVSNGSLILMQDRLVCLTEAGRLVLARACPLGYEPLSSFSPFSPPSSSPCMNSVAASDGRIYASNPKEMVCLDASIPAPLKLDAARLAQSGALCLTLSSSDGRPIYTNRVPQLGIRWTSDPRQPLDAWFPLPAALVYTNGVLFCEQSLPADGPARFYSAVEVGR